MKEVDRAVYAENGNTTMERKIWETFQKSFSQVQTILDQNRILISEINQNHESKMPENLTRNVALIRELNSNIARVVKLYANLSEEFIHSMDGGDVVDVSNNVNHMAKMVYSSSDPSAMANGIPKKPRHG